MFGEFVAGRAVPADAHAQNARPAAFALRLQHGIQDHFAAAVEVAVGFEFFVGQGILSADVFAAAAFEHEPHVDFVRAMLMKMKRRRAGAHIRSVIDAGERVHRVLPQVTEFGRFFHRQTRRVLERDLVHPHRALDIKQNAAGVLADRLGFLFCELNVAVDDFHRGLGDGALFLPLQRIKDGFLHVVGNLGGSAANQLNQRILKRIHAVQP